MKNLILQLLLSTASSFCLGLIIIPILKRIKAGQPILKYVETHKDKNGTPTMGGLFFITSSIIIFYIFNSFSFGVATFSAIITFAYMIVGFLDDFLKIKQKDNEGLKPYQKIVFQFAIAIIASVYCLRNGITTFNLPFTITSVSLGYFTIPIVIFIFLAITNSVNLTDGLDGLASSVSVVYLLAISVLIYLQGQPIDSQTDTYELISLSICFVGGLLGFLIFNVNKASVFMGDTGSLALGGLVGSVSIFSNNALLIPILGFTFVFSAVSVILQVLHYKRTKKRLFLMAPYHHHLQLKGLTESKIVYIYSVLTSILGISLIISYL